MPSATKLTEHIARLSSAGIVVMISLLAAGYWFTGLCYSRGYDYFLWLYNAWLAGQYVWSGDWPNWSPYSGSGHPFFKMAGVSDAVLFSIFTKSAGMEVGTRIYACMLYVVSGTGVYALIRRMGGTAPGAIVGATVFVFSWFLTYTAYYQTYLNNFLSYALMPWGALLFIQAISTGSRSALFAAAGIVFISIASNAQVSIRLLLFCIPLAYVETVLCRGGHWRKWFECCALIVFLALCWSAFLVYPALMLREEVLHLVRDNPPVRPWDVLLGIPLLGLNFAWMWLGGDGFLSSEIMAKAVHTDYIGISSLGIALLGLGLWRRERRILRLALLLVGYWFFYFLVVPQFKASAWVGIVHNWAVLPTLVIALLCSYGYERLAKRLGKRIAALILCGVVVVDLGSVSYFLNRLAITHEPLAELPEVGVWSTVEQAEGTRGRPGRWFTYNPDHTHYLLPIFTGRQTANIVELRSRNPEYSSYIGHQRAALRALDPTYKPGESLALLDCKYIDLPIKLFDYRGDASAFPAGVGLLRADPLLEMVHERRWSEMDASYHALRANNNIGKGGSASGIAQVVFRNGAHRPAAIPHKTILIAGTSEAGQKLFEQITHLRDYRAHAMLYVLADGQPNTGKAAPVFDACIPVAGGSPPAGLAVWDMRDLAAEYARLADVDIVEPNIVSDAAERLELALPANGRGRFLFLAKQRFRDWRAFDTLGTELAVYKAGAGLTAIWVPAGVEKLVYQYGVPAAEQFARIFSLLSFAGALVWCLWRRK